MPRLRYGLATGGEDDSFQLVGIRLASQPDDRLAKPIGVREPGRQEVRVAKHRYCDLYRIRSGGARQHSTEVVFEVLADRVSDRLLLVCSDPEVLGVHLLDDPHRAQGDEHREHEQCHDGVHAEHPRLVAFIDHSRGS